MKLDKYKNYIFDFDGTIVDLKIDWDSLKKEINLYCKQKKIKSYLNFYEKIKLLKLKNIKIYNIIKKYEQPNNKVEYKIKKKTLKIISKINEFYIVTNNLSSTASKVLKELKIRKKCKFIIGIENSYYPKPNTKSFKASQHLLKKGETIYIGDKIIDKKFAKRANINFKFQKEI